MAKFYYNGVLLPEIPADVIAEYPYCWIRNNTTSGYYDLIFSKLRPYLYTDGSGIAFGTGQAGDCSWYRVAIENAVSAENWEFNTTTNTWFGIGSDRPVLWSNCDIYTSSSSPIYNEGTEPVPEVLEDEKWYQISSYTLNDLAEQARRIDSNTTTPMTPPMMLDVFKGVPSYGAILEGYNVVCYDEYEKPLEVYRIKKGHSINKPNYDCKFWQLKDGSSTLFPITPTGDVLLYAFNDSLESELYEYYGVDRVLYPYLAIRVSAEYTNLTVYFSASITVEYDGVHLPSGYLLKELTGLSLSSTDLSDVNKIVNIATSISDKTLSESSNGLIISSALGFYTNFDYNNVTVSVATCRLDE